MASDPAKQFAIRGLTRDGKTFRPSDWAERLAGVMSSFRPGGAQPGSHLSYSPWCVPTFVDGVRAVVVHPDLRAHELLAWEFVMNFARDNELQVLEVGAASDLPVASIGSSKKGVDQPKVQDPQPASGDHRPQSSVEKSA